MPDTVQPSATKNLWHSKTFWANIIALFALAAQRYFGFQIDTEAQVSIMAVVNIVLRAVTKAEIV